MLYVRPLLADSNRADDVTELPLGEFSGLMINSPTFAALIIYCMTPKRDKAANYPNLILKNQSIKDCFS